MDSVVKVRECAWYHEPFHLHDGRYRYCSDECAEKARLAQSEGISCGTYETRSERERKKFLAEYWRRCYAAISTRKLNIGEPNTCKPKNVSGGQRKILGGNLNERTKLQRFTRMAKGD